MTTKTKYHRKPNRPPTRPAKALSEQPGVVARQMRELGTIPSNVAPLHAEFRPLLIPRTTLAASGLSDAQILNPSICVQDGKLRAVVRVIAHTKTYNFLGHVSDAWELSAAREVKDVSPGIHNPFGYEDCRLFGLSGRLYASATILDGHATMVVLELSEEGDVTGVHAQKSDRHEKNWMPVTDGGHLWFVYSVEPLIVLRYDNPTHLVKPNVSGIAGRGGVIRGSSQLQPYANGFIAVVHQVHQSPTTYLHRIVRFDRFLQVVRMSEPFYFIRRGIEFCAGLVHWRGAWVMSFGLADNEAYLAVVEDGVVDRMVT